MVLLVVQSFLFEVACLDHVGAYIWQWSALSIVTMRQQVIRSAAVKIVALTGCCNSHASSTLMW